MPSGTVDNPFTPLFAILGEIVLRIYKELNPEFFLVATWGIFIASEWRRLEIIYQNEWSLVDYQEKEVSIDAIVIATGVLNIPQHDRKDFVQNPKTYKRLNNISSKEEFYPDPIWRIIFLLASVMAGALALPKSLVAVTAAQYRNAYVAKLLSITFINEFFPIFCVAFLCNRLRPFGADMGCPGESCVNYLEVVVGIVFLTRLVSRRVFEIIGTYNQAKDDFVDENGELALARIVPRITNHFLSMDTEEVGRVEDVIIVACIAGELSSLESLLQEFKKPSFPGIDQFFDSRVIDLGYVLLFGSAFPLMVVKCRSCDLSTSHFHTQISIFLATSIFEMRGKAKQLLFSLRRPLYRCSQTIGAWGTILDIIVVMSIVTQSAYICFTSNSLLYYFPSITVRPASLCVSSYSATQQIYGRTALAIGLEHILLFIKAGWICALNTLTCLGGQILVESNISVPKDVDIACKRKLHEKSVFLDGLGEYDEERNVAFYTSDEGYAEYAQ
eukprot:751498-Hanusia_phi.AAC.4